MAQIAITGACGFIGSNLSYRLLSEQKDVVLIDNLSRPGSEKNLKWLNDNFPSLNFHKVDIRDFTSLEKLLKPCKVIYHLASQVAVTQSVQNPREDFEINALGAFNVLEAARLNGHFPIVVFPSTNKVYGSMPEVPIKERNGRYIYETLPRGVDEEQSLDFHSPYGCSKGAADQYMRDYYRIYHLPTVVLRMSCQFGPRQFGNEDQGWVAHFLISALKNQPISIYGDGKQVRDILYIDDLIDLYLKVVERIDATQGQVYNVGGGIDNTLSLLELIDFMKVQIKNPPSIYYYAWRPGDQRIYVSNCAKLKDDIGWTPQISKTEGLIRLLQWLKENPQLFTEK